MEYLALKTVHILSAILLFGTGLGSAFYKLLTDLRGNLEAVAVVNRLVVTADWLFTTPTVIVQPLSGLYLLHLAGWPLTTPWIAASLLLYVIAGLCWLPVVVLQIRMRDLAETALRDRAPLPASYRRLLRQWFWLGLPAFFAMVLTVALMVFKPTF